MRLPGDRRQETGDRSSRRATPASPQRSKWSHAAVCFAAAVAAALLAQTPVVVQEHQGRRALSLVELSALREWDAAIDQ